MKSTLVVLAAIALLAVAVEARAADGVCGNTAPSKRLSADAVRAKATEMGYDVRRIKFEDGCFELHALDKDGKRVEAYLDPLTARVVKTKVND